MARTRHKNATVEVFDRRSGRALSSTKVDVSKAFKTHHAHKILYQAARDEIVRIADIQDRDIESFGFTYCFEAKVTIIEDLEGAPDEVYNYLIEAASIHPWSYLGVETKATLI